MVQVNWPSDPSDLNWPRANNSKLVIRRVSHKPAMSSYINEKVRNEDFKRERKKERYDRNQIEWWIINLKIILKVNTRFIIWDSLKANWCNKGCQKIGRESISNWLPHHKKEERSKKLGTWSFRTKCLDAL